MRSAFSSRLKISLARRMPSLWPVLTRLRTSVPYTMATVPERSGDFSDLLKVNPSLDRGLPRKTSLCARLVNAQLSDPQDDLGQSPGGRGRTGRTGFEKTGWTVISLINRQPSTEVEDYGFHGETF